MPWSERGNSKDPTEDPLPLVLPSFAADSLEWLGEIVIIGDWMAVSAALRFCRASPARPVHFWFEDLELERLGRRLVCDMCNNELDEAGGGVPHILDMASGDGPT